MSDKPIRNFAIIFFASLFLYLGYTRCIIGTQTKYTYDPYVGEIPVHKMLTTFEVMPPLSFMDKQMTTFTFLEIIKILYI